ncbi:DUF3822 family protein [Adhaeribacter swui]|uniref:DUF3822 family protein n=1 Tax=Adhaeribacter swui TaxID=2086471 RepID=A0A7G7GBL8_9BACT|nr:DUF3822 family protein [Adhaeribacter swui]QNF34552.1 DUF3822 family protein [Adhaeribacter swui]
MATETKNHRLFTQLIDESFSVVNADVYNLYITLSKYTIRFGVEDNIRHKFLLLEDYTLTKTFNPLQLVRQLREIILEHAFLSTVKWHQVRVGIKNQKFTFLPGTLYQAEAAEEYLKLHSEIDEFHDRVYSYQHPSLDMVTIFATDQYLPTFLQATFPPDIIQIRHQVSAFIETLLHITERSAQKRLYAYVEQDYLTLIIIKNNQLEFGNVFYYATPEDFIYFLIFVMQEHELNPDQDPVTIWGDVLHDSDLFDMMRKYVRNLQMGKKPSGLSYSYKFEEQFDHRYLEVFSLHYGE